MTISTGNSLTTAEGFNADSAEALLNGGDDYEEYLALIYFRNLFKNTDPQSPMAYKICHVFENTPPFKEYVKGKFVTRVKGQPSYPSRSRPERGAVDAADWDKLITSFDERIKAFDVPEEPTFLKNLTKMAQYLNLSDIQVEALRFYHVAEKVADNTINRLSKNLTGIDDARVTALMARFIDKSKEMRLLSEAVDYKSPIVTSGLIDFTYEDSDQQGEARVFPRIDFHIRQALIIPDIGLSDLVENVLGKPGITDLTIKDFSSYADDIEQVLLIIRKAVEHGEKGVNICLHGPEGTGKTAFAKTLTKELGYNIYAVGEDDDKSEPGERQSTARHRMNELRQAHSFLRGADKSIILLDEMEDFLIKGTDTDKKSDTESKIQSNRIIEENPVVTIWAGNNPEKFHPSFRQRFAYAIYMDEPTIVMRKKIWEKQLELKGQTLGADEIIRLARQYNAAPRMIENAVRVASMTGMSYENVETALKASAKFTYGYSDAIRSETSISDKFKFELVNFDAGKDNYIKAIIDSGVKPRPYSMLMSGRAGVGIKSFGRYLAEAAAMKTVEFNMRDLVEQNPMMPPEIRIRQAFEKATDLRQYLMISNVDALAHNAKSGSASWRESGLADVFVECTYNHGLPMVVSCYDPEIVIPSFIKNAFSLEVKLSPLEQAQCVLAYKTYFNKDARDEIIFPANLVPDDFSKTAKVSRKELNGGPTEEQIMERLKSHAESREATQSIGFGGPR